ncbi:hypothetical protein GOODEAATRI_004226 [Goodea atripinnis]|uniref:Uncharacterized protein n=1 Tax=Goodea atripinnis TaxID=208336 RepID=A0ABV0PB94_9TELE
MVHSLIQKNYQTFESLVRANQAENQLTDFCGASLAGIVVFNHVIYKENLVVFLLNRECLFSYHFQFCSLVVHCILWIKLLSLSSPNQKLLPKHWLFLLMVKKLSCPLVFQSRGKD